MHTGSETLGGAWLAPIGCADGIGKAGNKREMVSAGAGTYPDRFGAIAKTGSVYPVRHFIVGLIPGDTLPLSFTTGTDTTHGIFQTPLIIDLLETGFAQMAEFAAIHRIVGITFDIANPASIDMDQDAAAAMAHTTGAFYHL